MTRDVAILPSAGWRRDGFEPLRKAALMHRAVGHTPFARRPGQGAPDLRAAPLPGLEPRGAVAVTVTGVRLVGTHLALLRRWRRLEMAAIRAALGDTVPVALVAGDFNEWSPDIGFEPWAGALHPVAPGPTFHAARPVAPLDRFARGSRVTLSDCAVAATPATPTASDHLPIVARVARAPDTA